MKLSGVRRYTFKAIYRGYTIDEDPDTGAEQIIYEDPEIIDCWVSNNALGELSLHTKARLQNDGGIGTLVNKDNKLVYPIGTASGAVWRIIEGMPMYTTFGDVYEYKYRCLMIVPKQGSVTQAAPSAFKDGITIS
jgi:hypothetical protein